MILFANQMEIALIDLILISVIRTNSLIRTLFLSELPRSLHNRSYTVFEFATFYDGGSH